MRVFSSYRDLYVDDRFLDEESASSNVSIQGVLVRLYLVAVRSSWEPFPSCMCRCVQGCRALHLYEHFYMYSLASWRSSDESFIVQTLQTFVFRSAAFNASRHLALPAPPLGAPRDFACC